MTKELTEKLKYLHFQALLSQWDSTLKMAAEKNYSHAHLLTHVVEDEYRLRRENAHHQRLQRARIPEPWVIETYPFERQPNLNKKKIMAIYDSMTFMTQSQNILWLGVPGCGKPGLATSFLTHAIHHGHCGRYVRFADLVHELYQSVADHSEAKVLKHYLACDILLIDEMGYIEIEPIQVGLFFNLMQQRHKKKPTIITSNLGFSDWKKFLKNDSLTAALIDRLTDNSHVIKMKDCVSLRTRLSADSDSDS